MPRITELCGCSLCQCMKVMESGTDPSEEVQRFTADPQPVSIPGHLFQLIKHISLSLPCSFGTCVVKSVLSLSALRRNLGEIFKSHFQWVFLSLGAQPSPCSGERNTDRTVKVRIRSLWMAFGLLWSRCGSCSCTEHNGPALLTV